MKATDLMIGDWVYLNSDSKERKGYYKVDFIHTGEIGIRGFNEHREVKTVTPPYLDSIPLTEEILLANEFFPDGIYFHLIDTNFRLQRLFRRHEHIIVISGEPASIFYVHELQHALRLCGLNELADNFKLKIE